MKLKPLEKAFRRLQVVGKASYSISLPKQWVLSRGLKPGDFIEVSEALDGSLRLSPPEAKLRRSSCKINADLCKDLKQLQRLITAGYRIGYDVISISSSKTPPPEISKNLENVVSGLPGMELSHEQAPELIIRNVLDYARFPVDDLVKRCYLLASEIFNNLIQFLETGRYDLMPYTCSLGNRLKELCQLHVRLMITYLKRREIGRSLRFRSPTHIYTSIVVATLIRQLAESLLFLARIISRFRKKLWATPPVYNTVKRSLESLSQLFDQSFNAYLSLDFDQANKIVGMPEDWAARALREELAKISPRDQVLVELLAQLEVICAKTQSTLQEIGRLALDLFMDSSSPICEVQG